MECNPTEGDLGILVDGELNTSQQCVVAGKKPTVSWSTLSTAQLADQKK